MERFLLWVGHLVFNLARGRWTRCSLGRSYSAFNSDNSMHLVAGAVTSLLYASSTFLSFLYLPRSRWLMLHFISLRLFKMRTVLGALLIVAAWNSTASAQQDSATASAPQISSTASAPQDTWSMDHGRAADAANAAKAAAAAAAAKTAAIAAGTPLTPSQSTGFSINGSGMIRAAPPQTPEEQNADMEARSAWQARCRPTIVEDREGLRRTQYAEPNCDLSRFNTAGTQ